MSFFANSYNQYSNNRDSITTSNESSKNSFNEIELTLEQRLNLILLQADTFFQNQQYEEAVTKLRLLMQKINFLKLNKKQYDKKLELVCLYNLAATYQKQWSLDQCLPLLGKFISLLKSSLQDNLKNSGGLHEISNKSWYKTKTVLIRTLLQYCAILSQIGQHQKAFKIAIQVTNQLKYLFKKASQDCSRLLNKKDSNKQTSLKNSTKDLAKDLKQLKYFAVNDKIEFSLNVLLNAQSILQDLSKMHTYNDITESNYSSIQSSIQDLKSKIYFWKNNPQNNIKMLRKQFNQQPQDAHPELRKAHSQRNLLGIKKSQTWIEEFTIAKVMFMSPLNYPQFAEQDNFFYQFNQKNILEKVILLSVAYFSLSIELRFLEQQDKAQGKQRNQQKKSQKKGEKRIQKQYESGEALQTSQILHLKSIEIICRYIKQNSAFVNHLVVNYHKHYKSNLNTIEQENSMAEYSELYDINRQSKSNSQMEGQPQHHLLIPPPTFRKDSVYYVDEVEIDSKQIKQVSKNDIFFKKISKKKNNLEQEKSQKIKKVASFSKFDNETSQKDKTIKKVSIQKLVSLPSGKLKSLWSNENNQKSSKQLSHSKRLQSKSLSKTNNLLNSVSLKQNKSKSPEKQKNSKAKQLRDLKESYQFKRPSNISKKKSPQPTRALNLLKNSGSLKDIRVSRTNEASGSIYLQNVGVSFKQKKK